MELTEQKTYIVVERIYIKLLTVKMEKGTLCYSDCFIYGFDMQYNNNYCHLIWERAGVINNIPYILGAIGRTCNDFNIPPLCCLVVNKSTGQCGDGVITSKEIPIGERSEFAEKIDRPNVYNFQDYPKLGTPQYIDFLNCVMNKLREEGIVNE